MLHKKKTLRFILISIAISFFSFEIFASVEKIVFYTEDFPPFNFKKDSGELRGIAVELLEQIHSKLGYSKDSYSIILAPWARGYEEVLTSGQKNAIFSTTRTAEREKLFKWVGPIAPVNVMLFKNKGRTVKVTQDSELAKFKYCAIDKDIGELTLINKGVPQDKIVKRHNLAKVFSDLQSEKCDFLVYDGIVVKWLMTKFGYIISDFEPDFTLTKGELYYAFNLSVDDKIIADYQKILDEIRAQGTLEKLINTYLLSKDK